MNRFLPQKSRRYTEDSEGISPNLSSRTDVRDDSKKERAFCNLREPLYALWFKKISLFIIALYRLILSPWTGNQCRFHPTCSCYAKQAIEKHGALKGWLLAVSRILRCHPWSNGQWIDPVPERFAWPRLFGYKRAAQKQNEQRHEKEIAR